MFPARLDELGQILHNVIGWHHRHEQSHPSRLEGPADGSRANLAEIDWTWLGFRRLRAGWSERHDPPRRWASEGAKAW
ncbi:hypothetical protein GCM10009630_06660 [Kribbella jejuensis]